MENNNLQSIQEMEADWEFFNYALDLEKQWEDSLPRLTDKELLDIFPEAKIVIPLKIKEWEKESHKVISIIKNKLRFAYKKSAPENHWFWREIIKQLDGERLVESQKHLIRLRIQQALTVCLVDIAAQRMKLRRNGKTLVGLCPFHNERKPSFHIYHANNSFYCYGCQKGGNVINFVRELEGLSFREAIKYLTS